MKWAVGKISADDPRGLLEKIEASRTTSDAYLLISLIDETPNFSIGYEVWVPLLKYVDGVGLSLSIDDTVWTTNPIPDVARAVWLRCDDLSVNFGTSDLDLATEVLLDTIRCRSGPIESHLFLGRYSSFGQFNLFLSNDLIREFARLRISIQG